MDFLDPLKRHHHRQRLLIGYGLAALVMLGGTLLLFLAANGYGINPKTHSIVKNGLLFVDSRPGGATIKLNGAERGETSSRLVLPEGTYSLNLSRVGYQTWQRKFKLPDQSIVRLDYPILYPIKPASKVIRHYNKLPDLVSLSLDQRWLLVGGQTKADGSAVIESYDTKNLEKPSQKLSLRAGLLTKPDSSGGRLKVVAWALDNQHILLSHSYRGAAEYLLLNRTEPNQSVNINKLFKTQPSAVAIRDNKAEQLYIYGHKKQTLQVAVISQATLAKPFLRNVSDFRGLGQNQIVYVTKGASKTASSKVNIWDNGQNYRLASLPKSGKAQIGAAIYRGDAYFAVGSSANQWLNLYKNPLQALKKPHASKLDALVTLKATEIRALSFSPNFRNLVAQANQTTAVYDIETGNSYRYSLAKPLQSPLVWLDDFHMVGSSRGRILVVDYDGANLSKLMPTSLVQGAFITPDYHQLITISPDRRNHYNLQAIELRAGPDIDR